MSRLRLGAVVVAGVMVATGVGTIWPASSQPASTLSLYAKDSTDHVSLVNQPPRRSSFGDQVLIRGPLFDSDTDERVGRYYVIFETVQPRSGLSDARFTAMLRNGKLTAAGSFNLNTFQNPKKLAITGGTSAFSGASGTLVADPLPSRTGLTFRMRP